MKLGLLLALAAAAGAADLGGHSPTDVPVVAPSEDRTVILEEMWTRRILAPDQTAWSPVDADLLSKIRSSESDALIYLKRKFGTNRSWTAPTRSKAPARRLLTRDGYEKYLFLLTQDAIEFFEAKGAGAKWALKLTDWDGKRLFDGDGRLTPAGATVYNRARLKLEVYWRSPNGEVFGTRRPPK